MGQGKPKYQERALGPSCQHWLVCMACQRANKRYSTVIPRFLVLLAIACLPGCVAIEPTPYACADGVGGCSDSMACGDICPDYPAEIVANKDQCLGCLSIFDWKDPAPFGPVTPDPGPPGRFFPAPVRPVFSQQPGYGSPDCAPTVPEEMW